ncbi:hypothetical protein HS088_TW06G01104 [Tripterygium wilfordii]|uniref:Uncharacterized protein n=1 Tax=Tripterygium wilfordii TaxID=458696 RepID=A0A7J7DKU7_TRIWF|nr:hypothetical protein HS088_TW06G01104 [Tripterygium wilfordii]
MNQFRQKKIPLKENEKTQHDHQNLTTHCTQILQKHKQPNKDNKYKEKSTTKKVADSSFPFVFAKTTISQSMEVYTNISSKIRQWEEQNEEGRKAIKTERKREMMN